MADTRRITCCIYDFDGVMTDNRVIVSETGEESVVCNRSDGLAIGMFRRLGIEQFILTTETNPVVQRRAAKLGLPCLGSLPDKGEALKQFANERALDLRASVYVGNDVNDLSAMQMCGMKVSPADGHISVRGIADVVTVARGGEGVIRELYDVLLGLSLIGG
jgi:YrbI family 3-deoxy-D-manno-octulosonate 8-phosphate phosphatase